MYSIFTPPSIDDVMQMLGDIDANKKSNPLKEPATAGNSSCVTWLEIWPVFVSEITRYET